MGVPKFFRWLSERYPTISQLIAENRIPEFDCLYLDMNGIIHNCTHKDSDSPTFRMTEDKMFIAIFNYIEHLFGKIKPQKLFFMAVDGVAPRAKMNQQRARRFRTALDSELAREKAIKEGLEMPKEEAFDSNCITPGTDFMARLTLQLKYFINKKVSEDKDWQGVEIVLSGHEVPGEGEHKIMEYIRMAKSQPDYDSNRRHCLYGLDADLIMLGLLSHDPHFCLLREEVTFGRSSQKKSKELEHQNFFLLHLCLVREYLELEFQELKEPGALSFGFDMERIIDDFILMAFFVGNDFLPNLPHLHINEGALSLMFNVYKQVLPKAQGYINESGTINTDRLLLLLDELSNVEYRFFEAENSDASWLKGKQKMSEEEFSQRSKKGRQMVISPEQKALLKKIKKYVVSGQADPAEAGSYDLPTTLPARDREFVKQLAESLRLQWKTVEDESGDRHLQLSLPPKLDDDEDGEAEADAEEASLAVFGVFRKYENAKVVDMSIEEHQADLEKKYQEKFVQWKNSHYQTKFGWGLDNEEELKKLTENYVEGLQWVLFYYYRGVASWPWFYRYHYAPMISDIKKGLGADMNFKLGQPFRPFQQLMGVLPDRSKKIVPEAYHELMTSKDSPIIDFYPRDFELDMNGKKQEWEAVVKIPFIEEDRLLSAMATKEHLLTDEERARNSFGVTLKFTYSPELDYVYPSSLPGIFPDLAHCKCIENIFELPTMDGLEVFVGLVEGVQLGKEALAGFPSLYTLPFTGALGFHGVNVFQQDSRNESMVVTLSDSDSHGKASRAAERLGKSVFVGYPFLQEAKVVKVTDELLSYTLNANGAVQQMPLSPRESETFKKRSDRLESTYSRKLGIVTGPVEAIVHVEMLRGLKKTDDGATVKDYAEIPGIETEYAAQTVVDDVFSPDQRFLERAAIPFEEEFPIGSRAFFLGEMAYGRPLEVVAHLSPTQADVAVLTQKGRESEFGREIVRTAELQTRYMPSFAVAKMLHLSPLVLSRLTSAFSVNSSGLRLNLGLNLKFESKKQKVLGYSRKSTSGWEYSPKAIDLIQQYMIRFPEFIAGVSANPKGDLYEDTDFYPKEIAPSKMKEIGQWLKSIEAKSFERVSLEAEQLDSDVVGLIEQRVDQINQNAPPFERKRIKGVPRNAILKPSEAAQRIGPQRFTLGDRVVYVLDSGRVPIGLKGTVVGMTRTSRTMFLDVVFDHTFMSGSSLGERCSPFRGSTVPSESVLNLTDKQVIVYTQASSTRNQNRTQPLTVPGYYGAPASAGGAGQYRPAPAPAPLRGSFRGALGGANGTARGGRGQFQQAMPFRTVAENNAASNSRGRAGYAQRHGAPPTPIKGHQNGTVQRGRGRGGLGSASAPHNNTQGFVVTDLDNPTEGVVPNNPNFRAQPYNAVPPPSALDPNNRGRGGRGGRGRGGFNGGRGRGGSRGRGRGQAQAQ